jgi:hypothetical protein
VHECVDGRRDDAEKREQEIDPFDSRDQSKPLEPQVTQIKQARNDGDQETRREEQCGAFYPEHVRVLAYEMSKTSVATNSP